MTRSIKLFVSSPYDVRAERRRVQIVVDRLNATFSDLKIDCYRWEDGHYFLANETFPAQIPQASSFDIVVGILWSRLGVPPPESFERMADGRPYPSGTAYELITAMQSGGHAESGADVMVYRKTAPVSLPTRRSDEQQEKLQQMEQLTSFMEEWFYNDQSGFRAAFHEFESTDDFDHVLETHLKAWLDEKGIGHRGAVWSIERDGSPYRGLDAYDSAHASVFFGRDQIIEEYANVLDESAETGTAFLLIDGPSGAGKSSLVRAGLLPRLKAVAEVPNSLRVATMFPGRHMAPMEALATALFESEALPELSEGDFGNSGSLAALLRASGDATPIIAALDRMARHLAAEEGYSEPPKTELVLLVDQGEEVLSDQHSGERKQFFTLLVALAGSGRCRIIFTIRARTFGVLIERLESDAGLTRLLNLGARRTLQPPGRDMLGEIIRHPAAAAGLQFERRDGEGLDERLQADASGSNPLPLLQYVLAQLFDRAWARAAEGDGKAVVMTFADYEAIGGVEKAIDQTAERACADLPKGALDAVPRLVRALTDASEDGLVLSSAPLQDVVRNEDGRALVRALIGARILVEEGHQNPRIRFAHDKVLTAWDRARRAGERALEFNRVFGNLRKTHEQWLRHGQRSDALLPGGVLLEEAKALQRTYPDEIPEDLQGFLNRSIRRSRLRLRLTGAAAFVFAVLAVIAVIQTINAQRNERTAEARLEAVVSVFDSLLQEAPEASVAEQSYLVTVMQRVYGAMREAGALPAIIADSLPLLQKLELSVGVNELWRIADEARELDRLAEALQLIDLSLLSIDDSDLDETHLDPIRQTGLGKKSYLQLLTGDYEAAIVTARQANALQLPQPWITANEAHGLLLNGQFDAAVAIYRAHVGEQSEDGQSWSEVVRGDFDALSGAGIAVPRRAEIEAMLTEP